MTVSYALRRIGISSGWYSSMTDRPRMSCGSTPDVVWRVLNLRSRSHSDSFGSLYTLLTGVAEMMSSMLRPLMISAFSAGASRNVSTSRITYSEFFWSFWPLFDSPSGTTTLDVIWLANVARSFGCTKSINDRPSHMSLGKPRLVPLLDTVPALSPAPVAIEFTIEATPAAPAPTAPSSPDTLATEELPVVVSIGSGSPQPPGASVCCSTSLATFALATVPWAVFGAVPAVTPPGPAEPFGAGTVPLSVDVFSFFFLRSLSLVRLAAAWGSGAMLLACVDALPP
uniref:Uncharacterized protein n=1 Tax=Anopheles merus TaxID=30066 RepID=A0A182V5N3_ANOME